MGFWGGHLYHHGRFYFSVGVGLVVLGFFTLLRGPAPAASAGDAFFAAYLLQSLFILRRSTRAHLMTRAQTADEGAAVVIAIALLVMAVNVTGVFAALNQHPRPDAMELMLVLAAAPLGWSVLHMIAAFHYANLHYFDPGEGGAGKALMFPGTEEPEMSDFVYFSFVIGMTAQVSDVQVCTRPMRKAVIGHSIASFVFNTVLIAMAVNAAVANAG